MKTIRYITLAFICALASATALVAKPLAGPKGGRIVTAEAPHVEFFVEKDRTVVVSFYDTNLKPVAAAKQTAAVMGKTDAGKISLAFTLKDGALVSTTPLPKGDALALVLQVRATPESAPKNYRLIYHEELCAECIRAEYACICDDAGGGDKH